MIGFHLTPEQEELRRLARRFAQQEIAPVAAAYDRSGDYPWEIIKKGHEIGLLNESIPTEYGGGGMGVLEACLIAEELSAACAGMATNFMANTLATNPIVLAGTPEQKAHFLLPFTASPQMAAFCLTEPSGGSDVAAMLSTVRRDGDTYVLNGTKTFISNGSVASLYTVFATLDPKLKHRGICAFALPATTPGVRAGRKLEKMGQRCADTAEVVFEEVRLPRFSLLGAEGEGFKIAMQTLDRTRPLIAAQAVGLARAAMEAAIEYAKHRVQFGVPIARHQAIQFMLADMATDIEAARLLAWQSAWLADQGRRQTRESAIAKLFATDMCMRVTTDAVQIFGGYGYMTEFPVEKYMRDAKLLQIYEGTNQIQRLVIARHTLGE
ncbi:MAG: acyl-CoA dehydrogenase [Candidatus Tectimicrobiota bacterium]|nr:MAG: acyl-CoA dehydrogenase [Candidatus Tectomicrobia bacterium]